MTAPACERSTGDTVYLRLQNRIGYAFQDMALLRRALTHPSSTPDDDQDNERLEFLGDAVLSVCIAQALYEQHPKWSEGRLTQVKSIVVSTTALARVADAMHLGELGHLGKGLAGDDPLPASVHANLFEAVCGAVFLDGGLAAARAFVLRVLDEEIKTASAKGHEPNYKSTLQQFAQRYLRQVPHYRVLHVTGPEHRKLFEVSAVVGLRTFPPGVGLCKKAAEQAAARRAMETLDAEQQALLTQAGQAVADPANGGAVPEPVAEPALGETPWPLEGTAHEPERAVGANGGPA